MEKILIKFNFINFKFILQTIARDEYDSSLLTDTVAPRQRSRRQKRGVSASQHNSDPNTVYTIEVLVVMDESMRRFHDSIKSNTTEYILSLMSVATNVFADASIGNVINIAVVGIENLNVDLRAIPFGKGNSNPILSMM